MTKDGSPPDVISRMGSVLRALSTSGAKGASTTEVARLAGLARPTAHRILASLMKQGFVDRDQRSGQWFLGPELYLLGIRAASRYDVSRYARASVHRLATVTGESAFFSARRGDETVCLLREDGSFPIRSFVLFEGARFPLGVVSSGIAVLSFLPDRDIDDFLGRVDLTVEWGESYSATALRERVLATRDLGYALNPGLVVEGSWGMAAAVFDGDGAPNWALTLTGVESRFRADRQPKLGRLLLDEAHTLSQRLAQEIST
jgi:DNA-binding IclR family transcriptional regulator